MAVFIKFEKKTLFMYTPNILSFYIWKILQKNFLPSIFPHAIYFPRSTPAGISMLRKNGI